MQKFVSSRARLFSRGFPCYSIGTVSKPQFYDPNHTKLMVVGSGFAGCTAVAHIPRLTTIRKFEMRVFDSQSFVSYSPNIDLLPFSIKTRDEIERPILSVLNDTTGLEFSEIEKIIPEKNTLICAENKEYHYDYLVLSTGLEPNYSRVKGLKEAIEDRDCPVITTATIGDAEKCRREFELFYTGKVLFYNDKRSKNQTSALNVSFLFDEQLRQRKGGGIRSLSQISYITNDNTILPYVNYSIKLKNLMLERQINFDEPSLELVEVDKERKVAIFVDTNARDKIIEKEFDLLFVNPEFTLPEVLKPFAKNEHFLDMDHSTLIHKEFGNVFALGHVARSQNTVLSHKAILEQSLVMNANIELTLMAASKEQKPERLMRYEGETQLPFFVGNNRCLVAEINPGKQELDKEAGRLDFIKEAYGNPKVYFGLQTQGVWFGDTGFKVPKFILPEK